MTLAAERYLARSFVWTETALSMQMGVCAFAVALFDGSSERLTCREVYLYIAGLNDNIKNQLFGVKMVHTLLDLPPACCAVVADALFLKWQQPERMRTVAGQRLRVGDRHKTARSDASCRCDCRRSWGCVHLHENQKRSSVVACGLWFDTNAFFAVAATLASPVGGTLLSTYIGARVAIVGSIMGCG
jgi:hypothetical protein